MSLLENNQSYIHKGERQKRAERVEGIWSQTKRKRNKKKYSERRKRSGGSSTYCLSAWLSLPAHHSSKTLHPSQLALARNTHTHTGLDTYTLSVSPSRIYTHTWQEDCWVTVQSTLSSFLSFVIPPSITPLFPLTFALVCVCHLSYAARGGGVSSGPVWPIQWKENCSGRQEPGPVLDICASSRARTQNLQNWWDKQEGSYSFW